MKKICLSADASQTGERIDKYLALELDGYSRSFLQKQLKEGNVTVGDKPVKSSYQLSEDDEICVLIPDNKEPDILPKISRCPFCMRTGIFSWWISQREWWCIQAQAITAVP